MRSHTGSGAGGVIESALFSAHNYVFVCSPWIGPSYIERLLNLLGKGVKLRIITSDSNYKDKLGRNTRNLLKDAVKPEKNFLGRTKKDWTRPSLDYKVINADFIHAKMYLADGRHAIVGSANLTHSGLWRNIEHVMIAENINEVNMIERDYQKLWQSYGGDVTVDEHVSMAGQIWKAIKG